MKLVFKQSAFKHGLTEEQIAYAVQNVVKYKNKFSEINGSHTQWAISTLPSGKTCELIGFFQGADNFVVFHAMCPARKTFIDEVSRRK